MQVDRQDARPTLLVSLLLLSLASLGRAQILEVPERSPAALTGSEFAYRISSMSFKEREMEIARQIKAGNVPAFLRKLRAVEVTLATAGRTNSAAFFVTPDYLALGSDDDYLLMPMSPRIAQTVADAVHCCLPTPKMVDVIYAAADLRLPPAPIPASPAMTSVGVFSHHNALVRTQRLAALSAHPLGVLVAGHKKDVVISARLASAPGKVAIYGWHNTNGVPIQRLYLGHTDAWVDYSQCIRLVLEKMVVNGRNTTVSAVLADPALAGLLSDEGVVRNPRYMTNAPTGGSTPSHPATPSPKAN